MHLSPATVRMLQSVALRRPYSLGTLLCLDRRHRFESAATPEQIAGVYAESVPDCCAGVRQVCERHSLTPEVADAVLDVWEVWHC